MTSWGGRRAQAMVALVLATYGDTCHLCGHPGADSADHLVCRADDPARTWDLTNLRPAHHRNCPTCGLACNPSRGRRPVPLTRPAVTDGTGYVRRGC